MAKRFLSNINVNDQYTLPSADGTSGQIIQTDGSGNLSFVDFASNEARKIIFNVKNKDSISLSKGTVVHASPSANPPSGNIIEVIRADNNDSSKMPAIGVLNETLAVDAEGECVMLGSVSGIATNSFNVGDELYVSDTPGEFINTKPTGTSNLIQKIAIVIKSHSTNGLIEVFGAGRSNDVPNQIDRNVNFTDNSKLTFGDSTTPDFQIYHDGNNSYINEDGTGVLAIQSNGTEVQINKGTSEYMARFITDGAVNLYYDNSKKFETTSTGVTVTGSGTFTGDVTLGDTSSDHRSLSIQTNSEKNSVINLKEGSNLYGFSLGYYGVANDFIIKRHDNSSSGTDVLTLNRDDNNATFAGTISANKRILVTTDGTYAYGINVSSSDQSHSRIRITNTGSGGETYSIMVGTHGVSNAGFAIRNETDSTTPLQFDTNDNATFAGDVTLLEDLYATNQNLKFHAGGTQVMNIDVNGKVYPNTHNAYDIGHSASLAWRNIYSSGTIFGNAATFAGSVGIGTTSPSTKLDVRGGTGGGSFDHATFTSVTNRGLKISTANSSEGQNGAAVIYNAQDGENYGSHAFQIGGSTKMFIKGNNVGIGSVDADSKLKVELNPSGTVLAGLRIGYNSTSVNFYDSDTHNFRNGAGTSTKMVINSSGNLTLQNGAVTLNKSDGVYLDLRHNNSTRGYLGIANQIITGGSTSDLALTATSNLIFGSGGTTERMRIDSSDGIL
jgi:hypothetical protein